MLEVPALQGIDLKIRKGDFLAFAGPSGSGKTTLLNLVGGLMSPTEGRVLIEGQDLAELSPSALSDLRLRRIGFIFQAYNLIPVLTAYENTEFVMMLQKVDETVRREKCMGLLKTVGLEGMENRYPRELSGGQQQRVAIARAIVGEPAIVLADEPTANLDSATAAQLLDTMEMLNREKQATFIFSTHDPAVMQRAKTLVRLRDGMIESVENAACAG
ncbi:MAG: ABC transporter ATP-binding protein [Acidobacteria bacterium]|uniref:ABC transporter ATP-binding protein n=1 Tax=Candidatus Polarisedimenticola svalbardensis TaxID=2886004 RepID=A0A8J6XUY0_9BACT|nr:ABC transporter ATP-binding protein [Candidatus Polarisedimenticola svalbardensis]